MGAIDLHKLHEEGKLLGVFDLTQDEYRSAPGISRSDLMYMDKTPAHFKYYKDNPEPPTENMVKGTAVHTLILEPHTFLDDFRVMPKKFKTKSGNKYKAWFKSKNLPKENILNLNTWKQIRGMRDALNSSKRASLYLSGYHEKSFFWIDPETGILCKCRPDSIHLKTGIISDLKTCDNASPEEFIKKCYNMAYHVQNAFYVDGVIEAVRQGGNNGFDFKEPDSFMFVAVEKEAPYLMGFYDLPPAFVDEGRRLYKLYLKRYKEAVEKDDWSGYSNKIIRLQEKSWMYKRVS
ncbi:MAG: hypothetical protein GY699_09510 [Desulfobacteraceae bacterium]|nr:hypothetical protein [Desulfobacteraceae bacterium]